MAPGFCQRGVFPDAILVLLKPSGEADIGDTVSGSVNWRVIRLWEYQAEDLFAMNDPGLIPWITLTQTSQAPEEFLQRCRDVIDQQVPVQEREEMLVVTSIFAGIRYNDEQLLSKFLRSDHRVIESTTIQMLKEMFVVEEKKKSIRTISGTRFGIIPDVALGQIQVINDKNQSPASV